MNKKFILGMIILITLGLALYGYTVLPDRVVVQVDLSGQASNFYPKLLVILLQSVMAIGGGLGYYFSYKNEKKYLMLFLIIFLTSVITLIFNR